MASMCNRESIPIFKHEVVAQSVAIEIKNSCDKIKARRELLKRRGQEYFTLVLTKNYSNLVAALSYCSDEGN